MSADKNQEELKKKASAETGVCDLLQYIGEDLDREGLLETPARHVRYLKEFCSPPDFNFTTFSNEGIDEMIVQSNISFVSLCEHHILPFFGRGTIAYIPGEKIVGLSKLARTLELFSRRLQIQERITTQVAEYLVEKLQPKGVAVVLSAEHMCMQIRGVKKDGAVTTTSCLTGIFKQDARARNEFLQLAGIK